MVVKRHANVLDRNVRARIGLSPEERASAEAQVKQQYPTADRVEAHPYGDSIYCEAWFGKKAKLIGVRA